MYRYLKFLHITDFFLPRVHLWFRWQISGMYWQSRVLQKPLKCIQNRHQFRISTNSTKKEIKFNWPFQNQAIAIELKRKVLAGNTDESIFTLLQSGLELILLFPYYSPPPTSQSCHRVSGFSASVVHLSSSSFSSAISSVSVSSWPLTPAGSPDSFIAVQSNLSRSALVTMLPTSFESWNSVSGFSDYLPRPLMRLPNKIQPLLHSLRRLNFEQEKLLSRTDWKPQCVWMGKLELGTVDIVKMWDLSKKVKQTWIVVLFIFVCIIARYLEMLGNKMQFQSFGAMRKNPMNDSM